MAMPLIVEPDTEALRVVLLRDCTGTQAEDVTLTIRRKRGPACEPVCLMPNDPCFRAWPTAYDVPRGVWGGCGGCGESNCDEPCKTAPTLAPCSTCDGFEHWTGQGPVKVYSADRIENGIAVFELDEDMWAAPEGWYTALVHVSGCQVGELTLWVRCTGMDARAVEAAAPCTGNSDGRVLQRN